MEEQDRSNFSVMTSTLSAATVNELLPTNCSGKKFQLHLMQDVCQSDNTNPSKPKQDRHAQVCHADTAPQV